VTHKESLERSEKFAQEIITLAAAKKLTVAELYRAADIAKEVANNSIVDEESIEKTDFSSRHIVAACDGKELFSAFVD